MDLKKINDLIVEKKHSSRDVETKLNLKYWGCLRTVSCFFVLKLLMGMKNWKNKNMTILDVVNGLWDVPAMDSMEKLSGEILYPCRWWLLTFGILQGFVVYLLSGGFFHHEVSLWKFIPGWAADGVNSILFKSWMIHLLWLKTSFSWPNCSSSYATVPQPLCCFIRLSS